MRHLWKGVSGSGAAQSPRTRSSPCATPWWFADPTPERFIWIGTPASDTGASPSLTSLPPGSRCRSENGAIWISFNGEIYNFAELRRDLIKRGYQFRTSGDTEVIVNLYQEFGEACVQHLRGMFAFAIWDARSDTLFLARDRIGC